MSLYRDDQYSPVSRPYTPDMLYENTFSDTDDDDDDDISDEMHQPTSVKNLQPLKGDNLANISSLGLDQAETEPQSTDTCKNQDISLNHSVGNTDTSSNSDILQTDLRTKVDKPSPKVVLSPIGQVSGCIPDSPTPSISVITPCSPTSLGSPTCLGSPTSLGSPTTSRSMTTSVSHMSTNTSRSETALNQSADTSGSSAMLDPSVKEFNQELAMKPQSSGEGTAFNRFLSQWTLNDEDLRCFQFRNNTNKHGVPSKQPGQRKRIKKSSRRDGFGGYGGMSRLVNMSPYAMLARVAKKNGYDLPTFLETLEYTGSSGVLPCMQCNEKYGGMNMSAYGSLDGEEYMEEGQSARNGRCQSCGGQVHTMASYGVMLRKLKEIITEKDFIPHDVYPDGNCLFAAVIDQLHIHSDFTFSMHSLRLASVEYIRNNPTLGDGTPIEMFLTDGTLDTYLEKMSVDGEWGDHIILSAVANVINMPIYIYGGMSGQNETIVSPNNSSPEDHHEKYLKNIFLGHIGESHYISLRPRNWKENTYDELVEMRMNEKKVWYPMQYFNFILTQIFRMDTSSSSDCLSSIFDQITSSMAEDEIDVEIFGLSQCKLVPSMTERKSEADDISAFFPSAKVEDVTKEGEGIFCFHTPQDTEIVSDVSVAGSFDLIIEPHQSIDLLKLVPFAPKLWEGQTEASANDIVYLKNINLSDMDRNRSSSLGSLDHDFPDTALKLRKVFAFKCSWPKASVEWSTRLRKSNFPNSQTVETVIRMGCHAISLDDSIDMADSWKHPESEKHTDLIWCYSFACAEKEICRFISPEQKKCYLLFRSTAGMVLGKHILPMAIFKTIFFYSCENIPESIWLSKPGECYFIMLKKLAECLEAGYVPHYFMSEKNLLESVDPESINENQKMLTFAKYLPVTSLYFVLDSLKLISTEVGSFVEEMIQGTCNMDTKDELQTDQIMRAGSKLLGSFIAEASYHNAMLVFNSLVEQTVLSSDKSLEILNKQLTDIYFGSKWCFGLYVDIRQKASLAKHLCDGMHTIHITEVFGPDCTEELPDTCLPERYSIDNGNLMFISLADEVLEMCVSTKVHTKCLNFFLKKYSELAGDAFLLPAFGVVEENSPIDGKHLERNESYIEQMLHFQLLNLYARLFNKYDKRGTTEEFRELLPAYEKLVNISESPSAKRNLYCILESLGDTKKAQAIARGMGKRVMVFSY